MTKTVLFSLEQCMKCQEVKELLAGKTDIEIITFPHDITQWKEDDFTLAKSYNVFEDLQKTAPILWLDGEKKIGYLRIRKWLQDTTR
jgi:glutaredoxin